MNFNALKKPAEKKESLLAIIMLILVLLMIKTRVLDPKNQEKMDLDKQVQSLTTEWENLKKFNEATKQVKPSAPIKAFAKKEDPRIQSLTGKIEPVAKNLRSFLLLITRPDFLGSLSIDSLSESAVNPQTGYTEREFHFNIHGHFESLEHFLNKLEVMPAPVNIDTVSIKVSSDKGHALSMEIKGVFYELAN